MEKKLTKDEIDEIENWNFNSADYMLKLNQHFKQKIFLNKAEKDLEKICLELLDVENGIKEAISKKYGVGDIDLDRGVIIIQDK